MDTLVAPDRLHPDAWVTVARPLMGGTVSVHVSASADRARHERDADLVLDRIGAWAGRLTRFDAASELARLNAASATAVPAGPTLTAVLDWGREAESITGGLVDIAMLDARLAAEHGGRVTPPVAAGRRWSLARGSRGATVLRQPGVRIDLDGVAKGWLADRALDLVVRAAPGCTTLVDGDGDIAARVTGDGELYLGVADPRVPDGLLAVLRLTAGGGRERRFGLATSGTSVHRWDHGTRAGHHLIDPATWRPACTDVVQATVLAETARVAEAFAKAVILAGADRAPELLDRPGVHGALLLTTRGEVRATNGMLPWLA